MLEYIIKSGSCLIVLFSFYKLFLEAESFHGIKRFYLILMLAVSLILPLVSFTYEVRIPVEDMGESVAFTSIQSTSEIAEVSWWQEQLPVILLIIYITGFSGFSFRFYKNFRALITEARKNDQLKDLPYIYVLLTRKLAPYSFFQYIFLNKEEFNNDKISEVVVEHEKAHVDQKHSLDLLLLEFIHIVFWFNPVFIFIKHSVKLNHEFLADHRVLQKAYNPLEYSNILFQYSSGHHHNSLSSPINHSLIKKRIIMITKSFSLRRLLWKSFIFLPVLGGCVYLFNEEIVAKPVLAKSETINTISEISQQQDRTITIQVEEENILLNGKSVSLDKFSEALDKLTENWSRKDLENPWFEIDFSKSTTYYIERLNKEYRKSRLSKISDTEFLLPNPVAPGGTPPPPPPPPVIKRDGNVPPSPPSAPKHSGEGIERNNIFSINITGNTLKVNGKEVKPKNFAKTLDKLSEGKTDEDLKNSNFRMHISDPGQGFMNELNQEFKKSRISKVTGHEILPPPPPAPPAPPKLGEKYREKALEWRKMKDAERKLIVEERERLRAKERELREDKKITQAERAKIQADIRKKEIEIDRRKLEIERDRKEIEREHKALEREQMPEEPPMPQNPSSSVPTPQKSSAGKDLNVLTEDIKSVQGKTVKTIVSQQDIESKYPEDAVYYLNDEKISYDNAMKVLKEGKVLQVDIRKNSENLDVVKIYK